MRLLFNNPPSDQPPPTKRLVLIIEIDTVENGQPIQEYLELHDTGAIEPIIGLHPPIGFYIYAYNIDVGPIPTIAAMNGVLQIREPPPQFPAGSSLSPPPKPRRFFIDTSRP